MWGMSIGSTEWGSREGSPAGWHVGGSGGKFKETGGGRGGRDGQRRAFGEAEAIMEQKPTRAQEEALAAKVSGRKRGGEKRQ